ncbi:ABC transporter ATP-binding protein [Ancylobacter amanitiformis]|uniref:Peptide/nickel transport system ATP-binding protein n=1 Tax=Ancylobacter amanitiformis TaxID=217069 RepID=A0ABU0LSZ7_9HYPH|nr:ABC transporter ATP-binding protein [Ancylobacter amanitiformis]MDQ0511794.1 peptide/nickel transport system ATP-binding protein [Ancylobacter amanitiformis]
MEQPGPADVLRIENLRISFTLHGQPNEVVKGVSLRVPAGRTVALVGESGSGKTVISQAVMGLLPRNGFITQGQILFADPAKAGKVIDLASLDRDGRKMRKLRGGRIGMIFQEPMSSLSPVHTIGNQIEEALQLHRPHPRREARAVTERMLDLVGFRDPHRSYDQYSFELSGGLRQRAMLAMALICRPALLIADEPTTALDVTIQAQVLKLMKDLQQEIGMAILLITHDLGVVANMADEVVVAYRGQIMEAGTAEDIFRRPQHPYLKALLKASPDFDMKPGERLVALREIAPVLPRDFARGADEAPARVTDLVRPAAPPVLLSVRNLRKTYGAKKGAGVVAVDDVSFDVLRGQCLGLVGESGSGKSTVGHMIMRSRSADSGSIIVNDPAGPIDVRALEGAALRAFRPRMQMIFQDPVSSLSPRMTVLDIIREPMIIQGAGTDAEQKRRAVELMECVGLDPRFLSRYPHSFSGGQRQRIGIARAIALNPELIICDEPVSALDVSVQAQVLNLLKDLQASLGLTYLFVSHNLAVVHYMAARIAVMARGRLVEIGPRDAIFERAAHPYTQALLKAVPLPDLDRRLDFATCVPSASMSDPANWPESFRGGAPGQLAMVDLGGGHRVLADPACTLRDLTAA